MAVANEGGGHQGPLCPDCGGEGVADVWWEDEDGNEIDPPPASSPNQYPDLHKFVARQCSNCQAYWTYEVE